MYLVNMKHLGKQKLNKTLCNLTFWTVCVFKFKETNPDRIPWRLHYGRILSDYLVFQSGIW